MSFVLDTSTALAWAYSDETTQAIRQVFDLLAQNGAWVPGLWHLEIVNVLEMGVRRKRHNAQFRDATLADLVQFPIDINGETDHQAWGATLRLAIRHELTLNDAAYLELALRRNLPLATLDEDLRRAARAEKVKLLG